MIYLEKPEQFSPRFEVVSCFVKHGEHFLLLLRQPHKPQGNTWGVPAGKVEQRENIQQAMVRELFEETNLQIQPETLNYFTKVFVTFPEYDFVYHIFSTELQDKSLVAIDPLAHQTYRWVSPIEALSMNLIQDEDACIKLFYPL